MTQAPTASRRITDEVTSWPGVEAGPGRRGEFAFRVGRRELGHLHGDHAAHFSFPEPVWRGLVADGADRRPPGLPGPRRAGGTAGSRTTRTSATSSRCCG